MLTELKPCPFCGGRAEITTSVSSSLPRNPTAICICVKCGASGRWVEDIRRDGTFIARAAEEWNRRDDNG